MYLYLKLQKALLRLTMIIFVISLAFSIFFNYVDNPDTHFADSTWRHVWFFNVMYGTQTKVREGTGPWVQMAMCLVISAATVFTVFQLRGSLRSLYERMHPYRDKFDTEWLNSHTLFIKGLLKNDTRGEVLESILNEHLEFSGGKVIRPDSADCEVVYRKIRSQPSQVIEHPEILFVVRDYKKFTKVEEKRESLEEMLVFSKDKEPLVRRC